MNSFGKLFKIEIFGESHGPALGVVIDGVPAGLALTEKDFVKELEKRNPKIKGTTARKEKDNVWLLSGVFKGRTTGAPLLICFLNEDVDSSKYEKIKSTPRPGHADLTSWLKTGGFADYRGGGHSSGRLTTGLVAAGVIAKKLLRNIKIEAGVKELGGSVDKAIKAGDSLGGVIECKVKGLPAGLGEPFFDSLESLISHAVFAVPGIKAIEFGAGFKAAFMKGSEYNDVILDRNGRTKTNNSGGINGGISNGNDVVFRVAVRPSASIGLAQDTVDISNGKKTKIKVEGRHDVCFALRVPVIIEAVTAMVLVDMMLCEQKIKRVL
jgi:chorismate synthase